MQDMQRIKVAEHSARTSQAQLAALSSSMAHLKHDHAQVRLLLCAIPTSMKHVQASRLEDVQAITVTAKQLTNTHDLVSSLLYASLKGTKHAQTSGLQA